MSAVQCSAVQCSAVQCSHGYCKQCACMDDVCRTGHEDRSKDISRVLSRAHEVVVRVQCSAVQSRVPYSSVHGYVCRTDHECFQERMKLLCECSAVQCSAVQCSAVQCSHGYCKQCACMDYVCRTGHEDRSQGHITSAFKRA